MTLKQCHAAAAVSLACTAGAFATDVDMRFDAVGVGDGSVRVYHNGSTMDVFAGALKHSFRNGSAEASVLSGQIKTFCTELTQHAVIGLWRNDSRLVRLTDAPDPGADMNSDVATALQEVWAAAGNDKFTDANKAAALQIMIWEILTDGPNSVSLTGGNFKVLNNTLQSQAVAYFNSLANAIGSNVLEAGLRAVVHGEGQDQLVVIPVPLPGAAAAAALGCCLVAAPRRRRRPL